MAFKNRTDVAGGDALTPTKFRAWLRSAGLHDSNDPKKLALFQVIDNLLLTLDEAEKSIAALQSIINNLNIIINNNVSTGGSGVMIPLDGIDGEDAIPIPGPKGDKGDSGVVLMQFENESSDETWIIMVPTPP